MNKITLFFILIFSIKNGLTQTQFIGYVIDENDKPLEDVTITIINKGLETKTIKGGKFIIESDTRFKKNDVLLLDFSISGYETLPVNAYYGDGKLLKRVKMRKKENHNLNIYTLSNSKKTELLSEVSIQLRDSTFRTNEFGFVNINISNNEIISGRNPLVMGVKKLGYQDTIIDNFYYNKGGKPLKIRLNARINPEPQKHDLINGCLDSDKDKIPDKEDLCKEIYGDSEFCGCPPDEKFIKYSEQKSSKCFRNAVNCLTYHKGLIYAGSNKGAIFILDQHPDGSLRNPHRVKLKKSRFSIEEEEPIISINILENKILWINATNSNGHNIRSFNMDNFISLQDVLEENKENKIRLAPSRNNQTLLSKEGDTLAMLSQNGFLDLSFDCSQKINLPKNDVSNVFFIRDRKILIIHYSTNTVFVLKKHPNILDWKKIELKWKEKKKCSAVEISPNGEFLYIGHEDGEITLFSLE